jgi:catecholate siderophore receptor
MSEIDPGRRPVTPFADRLLAGTAVGVLLSCAMTTTTLAQSAPPAATSSETTSSSIVLDPVTVVGDRPVGYKVDRSASDKFTAPLLDTPKTVTVIPEEVIEQRGATSLEEVFRTTPGITLGAGEGGTPGADRPLIRGFNAESNIYIDGMRDTGAQTRGTFNLEQVEIVKGPGSAFAGRGSTGGSINLVTKTPKAESFVEGSVTLGTDQTKRATVDANYAVNENVAVRLNVLGHDGEVAGRDSVEVSQYGFAPSISVGLNGPTRGTLALSHFQTDDTPDYGIP